MIDAQLTAMAAYVLHSKVVNDHVAVEDVEDNRLKRARIYETGNAATRREKGPFAYDNWLAAIKDYPSGVAVEYPLFSDAGIIGGPSADYGPYRLTNTVARNQMRQFRPSIVLRVQLHTPYDPPPIDETNYERYHGGTLVDEIAALISLCLGIRLKAGGETRLFEVNGDPAGQPIAHAFSADPLLPSVPDSPILPGLLGDHCLDNVAILNQFPLLAPTDAVALVRAARLYQNAVWIAESAPELSWLMLTSAVETAAGRHSDNTGDPLEMLRASQPGRIVEGLLQPYGGELVIRVAEIFTPYLGATKKFIKFITDFLPDAPLVRPEAYAQHRWSRTAMRETLYKIYNYRSQALHGGIPFPVPMSMPPRPIGDSRSPAEIPVATAMSTLGATWQAEDMPILLHTFEYIVRHALLKWWKSIVHKTPSSHHSSRHENSG